MGRKFNLIGKNEDERIRIDIIEQQLIDLNKSFARIFSNDIKSFENLKENYLLNLPQQLNLLSKFLGEKPFFAGINITYIDFAAYQWLDKQWIFAPKIFKQFPNLINYLLRFKQLPTIRECINSDKSINFQLEKNTNYDNRFKRIKTE